MSDTADEAEPGRTSLRPDPQALGLPPRVFLYTTDQLASMLAMSEADLKGTLIHYDGRSGGVPAKDKLLARNIMPEGSRPEWRVAEQEFMRWLKYKRFRLYEATWARS